MTLQDAFVNNLKYYRKIKNLSQERLSELLKKGMNYITKIECKTSFPTIAVVEQIANILNIPAEKLFSIHGCPDNLLLFEREHFLGEIIAELQNRIKKEIEDYFSKKF